MAGGNPFMPPGLPGSGGAPTGGGPQSNPGASGVNGPGPSAQNSGLGRGPGASILAPGPPSAPPSGQAGPVPPSKQGQPFAGVHQNLRYLQNQFDDNVKAQKVLDHLRTELDQLMDMGDMVRPEHVIEAAGRLVGHGIGATQLAQIMSDMPAQGGEGLASWVRMHDVTVTQAENAVSMENRVLGRRLGVAGIKSLAASHLEQEASQARGSMPSAPMPMGGPAPSSPASIMGSNALGGGIPQGPDEGGEGG